MPPRLRHHVHSDFLDTLAVVKHRRQRHKFPVLHHAIPVMRLAAIAVPETLEIHGRQVVLAQSHNPRIPRVFPGRRVAKKEKHRPPRAKSVRLRHSRQFIGPENREQHLGVHVRHHRPQRLQPVVPRTHQRSPAQPNRRQRQPSELRRPPNHWNRVGAKCVQPGAQRGLDHGHGARRQKLLPAVLNSRRHRVPGPFALRPNGNRLSWPAAVEPADMAPTLDPARR